MENGASGNAGWIIKALIHTLVCLRATSSGEHHYIPPNKHWRLEVVARPGHRVITDPFPLSPLPSPPGKYSETGMPGP